MNLLGKSDDGATTYPYRNDKGEIIGIKHHKTKMENPIGKAMALQNGINNGI